MANICFIYLGFLWREFLSPVNYGSAFLIGMVINLAQGRGPFSTIAPFIVPVVVQAFSKASINFRHRETDILMRLPSERQDPAFVIDRDGRIVTSTGNAKKFFDSMNIKSLRDIFNVSDEEKILSQAIQSCGDGPIVNNLELYSGAAKKYYQVQTKSDHGSDHILLWLDDISPLKALDFNLSGIRRFSSEIVTSIKDISKENDIYDRLAGLILSQGYKGVFITRKGSDSYFGGHVFKKENGELVKSYLIKISEDSAAPLMDSMRKERVVALSKGEGEAQADFDKAHPFDGRVRGFLKFPIENYINYHEGDVSIIAFNKTDEVNRFDLAAMETVVNSARTATFLIDLAIANDEKFLQIITGLSAASEYSDEMTGKHILRVNEYSRALAIRLGCDGEFVENISQVAAMHDIGKVAIPEIIKLERRLTDPEMQEMRMHTIYGAQIIDQMIELSQTEDQRLIMARNIALHHHQQWNGEGYPLLKQDDGAIVKLESRNFMDYSSLAPLTGEEIPVEALIVSLADKYDALRNARQYKPAFSHEKTMAILKEDDRTGARARDVFGPKIAALFADTNEKFYEIYESMSD